MAFRTLRRVFNFPSPGSLSSRIIDITDDVRIFVEGSGIKEGFVMVAIRHTTGSIFVNENEPCLLQDLLDFLRRIVPPEGKNAHYRHNDIGGERTQNLCDSECANGDKHIQAALLGTSVVLDVTNGKVELGEWQRVLLFDGDRDYAVNARVMGDDGK